MQLKSLRALLLRKVADKDQLASFISSIDGDQLIAGVIESLTKMADAGHKSNHALFSTAGHITADDEGNSLDAHLLRDALGHHLSRYKSALNAGDRNLADQHLGQFHRIMHLGVHRLAPNSNGKMNITSGDQNEVVSPHPWEKNYTGSLRDKTGKKQQTVTSGWELLPTGKGTFPNHRYLEMAPHKEFAESNHNEAYPFHDIKVNGKYVNIEDMPSSGKFEPHVLDSHPAFEHTHQPMTHFANMKPVKAGDGSINVIDKLNNDKVDDFVTKHENWHNKPELEHWLNKLEAKHTADPTFEHVDGLFPSDPIHAKPTIDQTLHPIFGNHRRTPEYIENAKRFNGLKDEVPAETTVPKSTNPTRFEEAVKNISDMGIELPESLKDLLGKK